MLAEMAVVFGVARVRDAPDARMRQLHHEYARVGLSLLQTESASKTTFQRIFTKYGEAAHVAMIEMVVGARCAVYPHSRGLKETGADVDCLWAARLSDTATEVAAAVAAITEQEMSSALRHRIVNIIVSAPELSLIFHGAPAAAALQHARAFARHGAITQRGAVVRASYTVRRGLFTALSGIGADADQATDAVVGAIRNVHSVAHILEGLPFAESDLPAYGTSCTALGRARRACCLAVWLFVTDMAQTGAASAADADEAFAAARQFYCRGTVALRQLTQNTRLCDLLSCLGTGWSRLSSVTVLRTSAQVERAQECNPRRTSSYLLWCARRSHVCSTVAPDYLGWKESGKLHFPSVTLCIEHDEGANRVAWLSCRHSSRSSHRACAQARLCAARIVGHTVFACGAAFSMCVVCARIMRISASTMYNVEGGPMCGACVNVVYHRKTQRAIVARTTNSVNQTAVFTRRYAARESLKTRITKSLALARRTVKNLNKKDALAHTPTS